MITIDTTSSTPLHDQILRQLRRAIAVGELVPGDRLPAVRQLATDLEVNFNTVARAYRALETEGLLRTARGRGTTVRSAVVDDPATARLRARNGLRVALAEARLAAASESEIRAFIESEIRAYWPSPDRETKR